MQRAKSWLSVILIIIAISLILLPFLLTFNDLLAKGAEVFKFDRLIEKTLIPLEIRMVTGLVSLFGINTGFKGNVIIADGNMAELTWNCLGWQSFLLLGVSFLAGLSGKFTGNSKIETVFLGIIGTFLINIVRMSAIVILLAISKPMFAVFYHDIFAALVTIIWLSFFWRFVYRYILEEKSDLV